MNTAISQYVAGLRCLIDIKKGSPQQIEKAIQLFRSLDLEDTSFLEQGQLPPVERLDQLAVGAGMPQEQCRNQLLAFLYWHRKNTDAERRASQPG